jgi:NAD(P)-dependent dehydrogenase (short-subunit alcohol dehydrogenase family)
MGNGRAIALGLAAEGADLVVADIDLEQAEATCQAARALGRRALAVRVDVTRKAEVESMVSQLIETLGRLDILVNNAGVTSRYDLLELPEAEWDRVLGINLKGVFLCTQAAARAMVQAGRGGKIINISSTAASRGVAYSAHYSASKGGVELFTQAAARALAARGVYVNAIAPGVMETPLLRPFLAEPGKREEYERSIPLGRIGQPADLVGAAVFLASPASDFVTGTVVHVDGGSLA